MASEPSGVGGDGGGCEAYGVAENLRGSHQGVDGGVKLPQGNNTPEVTELPWGDETPRVTTAGAIKSKEDGRGRGGDKNPPTTRATRAHGDGGGDNGPMGGPRMAEPLRPQRSMAADNGSAENPLRNTAGTDSARPEHGALARPKYGLLAPMRTTGRRGRHLTQPTLGHR